jgi:hypothetical protein
VTGQDEIGTPEPAPEEEPAQGVDATGNPIPGVRSVKALNQRDFEASLLAMRAAREAELAAALRVYFAGLRRRVMQRLAEAA